MNHNIKLSYEISYNDSDERIEDAPPQKVEFVVDGNITYDELLSMMDRFIKAVGYYPPEGAELAYVKNGVKAI